MKEGGNCLRRWTTRKAAGIERSCAKARSWETSMSGCSFSDSVGEGVGTIVRRRLKMLGMEKKCFRFCGFGVDFWV